jgi:autotransporter-associated beta strand protein
MIGYSTAMHGIYLNVGSVTSSDGSIYFSGYTSSTNTGYYGIYSNAINASAVNGSIAFQGAKINSSGTGSGYLVNAAGTLDGSNNPAPIFAVPDSTSMASAASKGLYWTGGVTANTTSGYIQIAAKNPYVSGVMSSYGLALLATNQDYSFTASNAVSSITASVGSGSINYTNTGPLNIGSFNGIVGITAGTLTLSAGGLTDTADAGITVTNASTIAITNATGSYDYSGIIAGPIALSKSGAGTQSLTAANTYTGGTSITGGILQSGVNTASGPPISGPFGSGTVTINGGALDLKGTTVANPLSLSGTGFGGNGLIINSSTTAGTVTGTVALTAASSIKSIFNQRHYFWGLRPHEVGCEHGHSQRDKYIQRHHHFNWHTVSRFWQQYGRYCWRYVHCNRCTVGFQSIRRHHLRRQH